MKFNFEKVEMTGKERIENDVWCPGILDAYSEEVAAVFSTKGLNHSPEPALRVLGDKERFSNRSVSERIRAGRILAFLRNSLDPAIDLHYIIKSQLIHGGKIEKIDEDFIAALEDGNLEDNQIFETDGLITNLKGYPLYLSAADCYPVGIFDPENKAIGAFHSGAYGFVKGIVANCLEAMKKEYGTDPAKTKFIIAPGVSGKYTFSKKLLADFQNKNSEFRSERYCRKTDEPDRVEFDLGRAIYDELVRLGAAPENIELSKYHTDTNNDLFSSERLEGPEKRDSNGFMIVLK